MAYQAPTHILEVLQKIEFDEALTPDDPRFVQTQEGRGSQRTLSRLARKLGLDLATDDFYPPTQKHVLFFGHTGSGKSTELRSFARHLARHDRFFVVEVDVLSLLDRNNLRYADVLMAMAQVLLERTSGSGVTLPDGALDDLHAWFRERVLVEESGQALERNVKAGAGVEAGLPFLAKLFGEFSLAFKNNTSYKETLRVVVRNNFSAFAIAFNRLLRNVEAALVEARVGQRLLFVLDGLDKLGGEDAKSFFVADAEQLLAIEALVVYTAALSLKYEGNLTAKLDADLVLPMIKLTDADGVPHAAGRRAVREILLGRADRSVFARDAELDALIDLCGGHPREALRLLKLSCEFCEGAVIDADCVRKAGQQLASDFRRFLEPEDYTVLAAADSGQAHGGNDQRHRRLLYDLALLEYNDGAWRRPHPTIRLLPAFQAALAAATFVSKG